VWQLQSAAADDSVTALAVYSVFLKLVLCTGAALARGAAGQQCGHTAPAAVVVEVSGAKEQYSPHCFGISSVGSASVLMDSFTVPSGNRFIFYWLYSTSVSG